MKRVHKITPVSLYDIRGLESWLEDMAKRGLFLKKLRPAFSAFEREQARSLRCRVEPCRRSLGDEAPQAMLDLYQDFGWTFVCDTPELLIFATQDPDAPEPHSDPVLQGGLWKKLYRSRRRNFFVQLALTLFLVFWVPFMFFCDGTPVLTLLTTAAPILTLLLVFSLVSLPDLWADAQRLGLMVKQLEEGVPLDHRSAYPRRRWRELVTASILLVYVAAALTVQTVLPLTGGGVRPLEELTAFTPLSLAEVEGEGYTPDHFVMDGKDYANFCDLEHYLLCWNQWDVVQSGKPGPDNLVRLRIWRYDLPGLLSGLSAPLARELLEKHTDPMDRRSWPQSGLDPVWTVEYYNNYDAAFLALAHHRDGMYHLAAAAYRNKAVLVQYTGQSDLSAPKIRKEIVKMVEYQ